MSAWTEAKCSDWFWDLLAWYSMGMGALCRGPKFCGMKLTIAGWYWMELFTYMACIGTPLLTVHCIFLSSICHSVCSDNISVRCERSVKMWIEVQCISDICVAFQSLTLSWYRYWIGDMSGNNINYVRGDLLYVLTSDVNLLACLLAYLMTSLNSPPWEANSTKLIKFPTFCVAWRFITMFTGSTTWPHPEPDKSIPCPLALFIQDLFEYYAHICA